MRCSLHDVDVISKVYLFVFFYKKIYTKKKNVNLEDVKFDDVILHFCDVILHHQRGNFKESEVT